MSMQRAAKRVFMERDDAQALSAVLPFSLRVLIQISSSLERASTFRLFPNNCCLPCSI